MTNREIDELAKAAHARVMSVVRSGASQDAIDRTAIAELRWMFAAGQAAAHGAEIPETRA